MRKLKEQTNWSFTYKSFHAEKALVSFENKYQATIMCKNRGWNPVDKFYIKFEEWNTMKHGSPKLVPSYGGWVNFRGILMHAWDMETFTQIGEACGSFIEITREIKKQVEIRQAMLKVKENFTGFIPAFINVFDKKGNSFLVQSIVQAEGK
ncbi:hypothetical protein Csa_018285 [Cucumis sativus]|uniref:Uncharacterized protein n=1 Tax=Cucumis sativus TaxID=3659 RepID=A0A0A0KFP0_CUCSA|nr:hypothetical protein Csa_018285 [Cucumis sativus]